MATIRDVARVANVSLSTVSHVINGTRYVRPETTARVLRAMADLRYRHNRLASSLRRQRTRILGVLLPNSENPYFARILAGIEAASFQAGYNIILGNAHDDPQRELEYLHVLLSRQVDGILLISTGAYTESLELIAQNDVPVVMVDRSANLAQVDEIASANQEGGRLATDHLIRLGHHHIGCITGPDPLTTSALRVAGYRAALAEAGIPPDDRYVVAEDFLYQGGYEGARRLLALDTPPTAIFACNDLMAIGAVYAVHELGLRVPDDCSVIGFDDIPLASFVVPRLTTIAQPAEALGHEAVTCLVQRLQQPGSPAQNRILPVRLIERESCAALKRGSV